MGFNTTVFILNDELHQIADDPEFGKKLNAAIQGLGYNDRDNIEGYHSQVIETHHADSYVVCIVGVIALKRLVTGRIGKRDWT